MLNNSKCLILDVETSPLIVMVWDIKDQFIKPEQIVKDWDIMAWSAKWLGEPENSRVYYDRRKSNSDLEILKPLWKLLDEADTLITQNGKAFDARKINARFILHGMNPPSPYTHIDTYLVAKSVAAFTSHSLAYLTANLNTRYKKLSHSKYPGWELWKQCLSGKWVEQPWKNLAAWQEMKTYNIQDVLSTEETYNRLKPWAPKNTPKPYFLGCPTCGFKVEKRGLNQTRTKQRIHCLSKTCGAWDTEALPKKDKKE